MSVIFGLIILSNILFCRVFFSALRVQVFLMATAGSCVRRTFSWQQWKAVGSVSFVTSCSLGGDRSLQGAGQPGT